MQSLNNERPNIPIWQSYVWHDKQCFFVSTIERTYDTYEGSCRGAETIVWEYDYETKTRGKMVHQAGGVVDHQIACRCLFCFGEIPSEDDERYQRFNQRLA